MNENWKNHPKLKQIDPKKLEIMEFLIHQCQGKSLEMILPDLMAASSRLWLLPAVSPNRGFLLLIQKLPLSWML